MLGEPRHPQRYEPVPTPALHPCAPPRLGRSPAADRGFTIAELLTVVVIITVLASMALPVISFGIRRQKEIDLHARLRKITEAIDRYHDLRLVAPPNNIKDPPDIGQENYPKSLEELTKPIELNNGKFVHLLRARDLVDPMTGNTKWRTLATGDDPDTDSGSGDNVFEVHSTSTALALDGKTHYNEW